MIARRLHRQRLITLHFHPTRLPRRRRRSPQEQYPIAPRRHSMLRPRPGAVRVVPALFHTQGGLVVDSHARVLRGDDSPIQGLYASGGAAEGISGHGAAGYLAGNGLLPALGLAYLAAEHAADHAAASAAEEDQTA